MIVHEKSTCPTSALDEETFVERMVENIPEKPDNYETVISINLGTESAGSSRDATMLETGGTTARPEVHYGAATDLISIRHG